MFVYIYFYLFGSLLMYFIGKEYSVIVGLASIIIGLFSSIYSSILINRIFKLNYMDAENKQQSYLYINNERCSGIERVVMHEGRSGLGMQESPPLKKGD